MSMRKIDEIIIHCSATREGKHFTKADIDGWHRARGFNGIGYHYVVYLDGTVVAGRPEAQIGAHCLGHNARSIGICYVGGLDASGRAKDTRTPEQRAALRKLTGELLKRYPGAKIHGHREFAAKACPCFDVAAEVLRGLLPVLVIMVLLLASCSTRREVVSEVVEATEKSESVETTERSATAALVEMGADSVRRVVEYRDSGRRLVTVSIYAPRARKAQAADTQREEHALREEAATASVSTESLTKSEPRGPGFLSGVAVTLLLLAAGWWVYQNSVKQRGSRDATEGRM